MNVIRAYTFFNKHSISYEWKINEISSYIVKEDDNVDYKLSLESPKFCTGDDKQLNWHLKLESDNPEPEDKSWLSLYLHCSDLNDNAVKVKYFLFVLNNKREKVNVAEFYKWFNHNENNWAHAKFVKKADLEENKDQLLPDDSLTIGIELTVYNDPTTYSHSITLKVPESHVVADYRRLFESKEGFDVIIKVKDETFKAHRVILMARSDMFFKVFTLATGEKKNTEEVITLTDIEPRVFKSFLEFIYTDQVSDIDQVVEDLLQLSDKYLMDYLKDFCAKSLLKQLKVDNALKILSLAEKHNAPHLSDHVTEFIVFNAEEVLKTAEYKIIEDSNPSLALIVFEKIAALKAKGFISFSDSKNKAN